MLARIRKAMDEKDEGFTLIELLVVIIIIGILAAIAIPVFLNQRKKGYDAQVKSDLRNAATAEETYLTDYSVYTTNTTLASGLQGAGWKFSTKDQFSFIANGSSGYCIVGKNTASSNYFLYDSNNGGLNGSPSSALPTTCSSSTGAVTYSAVADPT